MASIYMQIAGVHFSIHCRDATVLPDPWPCYRSFETGPDMAAGCIPIELDIEIGNMPSIAGMRRLFDGESWSLFEHGEGFCISLAPRAEDTPPSWIACLSPDFLKGTVYCDEILVQDNDGVKGVLNPIVHRLDQLLVMYVLSSRRGILVHSAGADFNGTGLMFGGRSGAGKSTMARNLRDGDAQSVFKLLSDDRVAVRDIGGSFRAFGTPWAGEAEIGLNDSAPLERLFFLHHSPENEVEPIGEASALEQLLPLVSVPWYDRERVVELSSLCGEIVERTETFNLHFSPTPEIADFMESVVGG